MAKGPSYNVPFRRRREGKTDYKSRRALITSGLPRLVVRGTSKYTIVQIIEAGETGDRVAASATSRELTTHGWRGSRGNIPAAYLTGLLCGYRAITSGVKEAVLDIGLQTLSRGAKILAALRGVADTGIGVPHDQGVLPDESRTSGQHIADYANQLSSDSETYQKRFSKYMSRKFKPEKLPEHFSSIKESIISSFKKG
ncbi:MAG: 50S ribosomal protein L18 [Candidatus Bathyarchaeota archaeon]|nr:MAG: 50S ribosomal protein L18 [Candidatus Bathyarchaeota archaeon]